MNEKYHTVFDQIREGMKPKPEWCQNACVESNYIIEEDDDHYLVARFYYDKISTYIEGWGWIDNIDILLRLDPRVLKNGTIKAAWDMVMLSKSV